MTDKHIDSPLADDDGDAIKRITPARFAELDKSTVTLLTCASPTRCWSMALMARSISRSTKSARG